MIAIYKKELRSYFTHMMGYTFLAVMVLAVGIWFSLGNARGMSANFHMALAQTTIFFFILIPALTMRIFSEEARQKTDQLLFTSPLSVFQIVLGKFFAAFSLFLVASGITIIMPLMLNHHGELPVSQIVGSYIGFILLAACCIAVGVFISVLTDNQIIAAVITIVTLFFMYMMDTVALLMPTTNLSSLVFVILVVVAVIGLWFAATRNILATVVVAVLAAGVAVGLYLFNNFIYDGIIVRSLLWLSLFDRFSNFTIGRVDTADIVYYVSFCVMFIYFTINVIEKRRWR